MRPSPQRALADGVDVRDPMVRQSSSMTMPPRSPTVEAGGARELVARPDAGGEHDQVGLERRCRRRSACRCRRVSPATISLRVLAGVHATPERLDLAAQQPARRRRRPAAPSGAARTRRRASRGPDPCSAFAASRPSRPPPMTTPTRRALRRGRDRLEVLDGAVDEAAAAGRARESAARTGYEPVASTSLS